MFLNKALRKYNETLKTEIDEKEELITTTKDRGINLVQPQKEENTLDLLVKVAPIIQKLFPLDCMVGITDRNKFICYIPGQEVRLPDITGAPIQEGDAIHEAINTGRFASKTVPKEVFGIPFKATGFPVKDDEGNIIGAVGLGISLTNQETLISAAQEVATSTEQLSAVIEELASSAEHLAKKQEDLKFLREDVLEQVSKTNAILNFINDVATNTNLLGLNAAIEAARAGEYGRGFSVVAEEIRKMSAKSTVSVKEIKDILSAIDERVKEMAEKIIEISAIGQQQAASTQEISASTQNLAVSAEKIKKVAEII